MAEGSALVDWIDTFTAVGCHIFSCFNSLISALTALPKRAL